MTKQEQLKIAEMLLARSEITGKALSPAGVQMMLQDLEDLPFVAVHQVLLDWGRTSSEFPYPAKIREKVKPQNNELDDGRDIASKVIAAVLKCGSYQAEAAKAYIGEIGWECVQRMGGWKTLCSELTEETKGIMNAQIRDLAMTLKKKSMNGTIATPQDFPKMLPDGSIRGLVNQSLKKLD